jgi:hypothetical protein
VVGLWLGVVEHKACHGRASPWHHMTTYGTVPYCRVRATQTVDGPDYTHLRTSRLESGLERYYKAHLAKRLLHNGQISLDAERGMLAKLKVFQFTVKLKGMFHNMKLSADTMPMPVQAYRDHLSRTTVRPRLLLSPFWLTRRILTTHFTYRSCTLFWTAQTRYWTILRLGYEMGRTTLNRPSASSSSFLL